ncbi:metallophosphoesterase [Staphylococcus warneri]|uniref:metallophosphoesterase n=1 Tax=Staphylococcus warneri TaxID=1292 RepID=UPI00066AF033|nr:metallophosphoesterase [Staphylococcus warneri]AXZ22624.1 phosphohydrolase [Staphylococcus warneri]KTW08645.1 phosphohydrolase [Staphylococcus warneri]OIS41020.1 phosphohydrolase [Staphylococcus warneri]OIS45390.1 phosphohydrolase [Staphylococcus warneri]PTI08137.1 phosphohydrolase [Staphylococcus warneri]
MRIGAISDIHVDRHPKLTAQQYLDSLVDVVIKRNIELLVIAGDISNDYRQVIQFINDLKEALNIPILFVPGNHDLWSDGTDKSSQDIFDIYTQQDTCLIKQPYIINDDWAIVGHTGWYDYSFANDQFSFEKLERGKHYGATWQDKVRMDCDMTDKDLSLQAAQQVEADIEQVGTRKIILVTHVVTHPAFVVPTPHRIFDFFNAYIGTQDFNHIYQTNNIQYSIMGHVHFRKTLIDKGIHYICPCLGYQRQWRTDDISQEMNHALMDFII